MGSASRPAWSGAAAACIGVLVAGSPSPSASAAQDAGDAGARLIGIQLNDVAPDAALFALFSQAGAKYRLLPDVALGDARVTMNFEGVPFSTALASLLRTVRGPSGQMLTSRIEDGMYVIAYGPRRPGPKKITLDVKDQDVRTVLETSFKAIGEAVEVDKDVKGTVTISLRDEPLLETGLQKIVRAVKGPVDVTFRQEKGRYQILNMSDPRVQADVNKEKVSDSFQKSDLRAALKLLFQSVGSNYALDASVRGVVTLDLRQTPFREALEKLLKASPTPLYWRLENCVYYLLPIPAKPAK